MKKVQTVWVITGNFDTVRVTALDCIRMDRVDAIRAFCHDTGYKWSGLESLGYRCVEAEIHFDDGHDEHPEMEPDGCEYTDCDHWFECPASDTQKRGDENCPHYEHK